jgi:carboxylesterase type B
MPYPSTSFILAIVVAALVIPAIAGSAQPPRIKTLNGTIVGSSQNSIDSFLGIPFAKPPTGALRLKPPRPIDQPLGIFHATGTPTACPQIIASSVSTGAPATSTPAPLPEGEDCLTLNIQRPSNISLEKKLPVLFWIFGGAFQVGSTQTANASTIIQKSQALGSEIIYVTANYRANGFGFLAGKELQRDGSTNLGLRDQRAALQWVAENIEGMYYISRRQHKSGCCLLGANVVRTNSLWG